MSDDPARVSIPPMRRVAENDASATIRSLVGGAAKAESESNHDVVAVGEVHTGGVHVGQDTSPEVRALLASLFATEENDVDACR
jgi:hypothetical protein